MLLLRNANTVPSHVQAGFGNTVLGICFVSKEIDQWYLKKRQRIFKQI